MPAYQHLAYRRNAIAAARKQSIKPLKNQGEIDYAKFISGEQQDIIRNNNNDFSLFRIGDAVSSRNIHAAIYDALRILINI